MASRAPIPPAPPHLRLHAASLFSQRLPLPRARAPRCRGGRSRLLSALPSPPPSPASRSQGVSTAPIEREPPGLAPTPAPTPAQQPHQDPAIAAEVARLSAARERLRAAHTLREKLRALDAEPRVAAFFGEESSRGVLGVLEPREVLLLKCLVAAGQEHVLGHELDWYGGDGGHHEHHHRNGVSGGSALRDALYSLAGLVGKWTSEGVVAAKERREEMEVLPRLLKFLDNVEEFYDCIGGIIGYQIMVLELLSASKDRMHRPSKDKFVDFHVPSGLNLLKDKEYASQAALWGIEGLPELGEIYPIGGAGDRLGLVDSDTGESLPAALLPYCGRSLLEGLIRDLQAREFLHFKIFGGQCITPVAIMTSSVKDNHEHIIAICERLDWFGRGRDNFRLFEQPLVPVVNAKDGKWLISKSLFPVGKPGGHGAIWKLAYDRGVLQWLQNCGRKGATVRQVSNVVAATDLTMMALAGIGLRCNKKLGFASCERRPGATEGVNVLIEKQNLEGLWSYGITCIEYTEFEKYGIPEPTLTNSSQVSFPANTNILYVDLQAVQEVGSRKNASCLPGMVLNLKKAVSYPNHLGFECSAAGGRLECTMQNIADDFMNTFNYRCSKGIESELNTFIVYNERKRVTSSAKRKLKSEDRSLHQTPEGSLLDIMRNAHDLLSSCGIDIPMVQDNSEYMHSGPPFLIFLHPALGPFWDIIRQKFVGGSVSKGSELQIEVAEFLWKDVEVTIKTISLHALCLFLQTKFIMLNSYKLDGSFIILADNVMGSTKNSKNGEQILHYGSRCGRCRLQSVKIVNEGINWTSPNNVYWKHDVERSESVKIILHGNAEFEAKDVVLKGNHVFEVPDGHRMCIIQDRAGFVVKLDLIRDELMDSGTWHWKYAVDGVHVKLNMVEL
ncbi:UTP--glucose-1-phosphate uridylyltransferase 3, chloroplastic [Zea mays]|uniref:UTP--glucose-1-phosphate uridylyltransferase 3, chloroplastic n=1 Tax=Zea mays TaxID=4577 RepID=A0A3L6DM91_MAIZE|nr:UTP--glucose-1-phosphate uridylyltransferase 3, chloroplastic [Zea mays]